MVQDTGGVPLAAKGVVIGLNTTSMEVIWDVPFMSGTTLGDRFENISKTIVSHRLRFSSFQMLPISWIYGRVQYMLEFVRSTICGVHESERETATAYGQLSTVQASLRSAPRCHPCFWTSACRWFSCGSSAAAAVRF
jgi:hypothetical protein